MRHLNQEGDLLAFIKKLEKKARNISTAAKIIDYGVVLLGLSNISYLRHSLKEKLNADCSAKLIFFKNKML